MSGMRPLHIPMRATPALCALVFILAGACRRAPQSQGPVQARGISIQKDIVFRDAGGVKVLLDIAVPPGPGPFPLIVCAHDGGWFGGDKNEYLSTLRTFAARGYAVATVGYRLSPRFRFPAQVQDVRSAVRFLRLHAKSYRIDGDHVGAMGDSSGGQLALMLGLMDGRDEMDQDNIGVSSKVQCVVNNFGTTDFAAWRAWFVRKYPKDSDTRRMLEKIYQDLFGGAPLARRASPISYVSPDDPPVLTFQGSDDSLVPEEQARRLHDALRLAGVDETLVVLMGRGHGWGGKDAERVDHLTWDFFDAHLKPWASN